MVFTTQNFEAEVLQAELPVLVDFYADWCGPCKMMAPIVAKLEERYAGKLKVGKLNVDDEPEIAERYRVSSIPMFVIFRGGQAVETMIGAMPEAALEEKLQQFLA